MPEITYTLTVVADDTREIAGSFASGDDAADRKQVAEIRSRAYEGDKFAWCNIRVAAICKEFDAESEWLCGCSYESEEDFKASGYYDDMRDEARDRLLTALKSAAELYRELTAQD